MVGLIYAGVEFVGGGVYKGGFVCSSAEDRQLYNLISEPNLSLPKCIISRPHRRLPHLVHQLLPGLVLQHLIYHLLTSCRTKYSCRQLASIVDRQLGCHPRRLVQVLLIRIVHLICHLAGLM